MDKYTTTEIISKIDPKDAEILGKEQTKIVISNDSYAVTEALNTLILILNKSKWAGL